MTWTGYDLLMALLVVACALQGAWRGMVWQIAPIISLVLGYVVAYPLSEQLAPLFGEPPTNRLFAMIAIYLVVSLAVYLIIRSIRVSLERLKLVEFDRHLGFLLGGVKGALLAVVVTVGLLSLAPRSRPIILPSESRNLAARFCTWAAPYLPSAFRQLVAPYIAQLRMPGEAAEDLWLESPKTPPQVTPRQRHQREAPEFQMGRRDRASGGQDVLVPPKHRLGTNTGEYQTSPDPMPPQRPLRDPAATPQRQPPVPPDDPFFEADPDRALQRR
ncbi:MAG: hypothetical protein KatS3mg114_0559 [Planctomycetaceae bacterium]|nr:MAG: hypothetical protein KatS3mg114_0559 [Planctomycetaceae bacterium]